MIVFDMDGVLVDVSDSYRETICQTVAHFTGKPVTRELVQEYKNRGGFNNDWLLSQSMCSDLGCDVGYERVAEYFNSIFYGGLMLRERWIPRNGLLDSLAASHGLAIFTGRPREEALITLRRFECERVFLPLIGYEDVVHGKPHPEGLLKVQQTHPGVKLVYIGDTVDDARSAAGAGVPFVGVAHAGAHQRELLLELFRKENAVAVIENVNELPEALAAV
jgi:HAD superfamily phosphatase